jgi:hypothetical protein
MTGSSLIVMQTKLRDFLFTRCKTARSGSYDSDQFMTVEDQKSGRFLYTPSMASKRPVSADLA